MLQATLNPSTRQVTFPSNITRLLNLRNLRKPWFGILMSRLNWENFIPQWQTVTFQRPPKLLRESETRSIIGTLTGAGGDNNHLSHMTVVVTEWQSQTLFVPSCCQKQLTFLKTFFNVKDGAHLPVPDDCSLLGNVSHWNRRECCRLCCHLQVSLLKLYYGRISVSLVQFNWQRWCLFIVKCHILM